MSKNLKNEMSSLSVDSQDRPHRFVFEYMNTSPAEHYRTLRRFYIGTSAISLLSTVMVIFASFHTVDLNTSQNVEIVRVDGALVEEFKDERRSVLINNTKHRFSLLQSGVEKKQNLQNGVENQSSQEPGGNTNSASAKDQQPTKDGGVRE